MCVISSRSMSCMWSMSYSSFKNCQRRSRCWSAGAGVPWTRARCRPAWLENGGYIIN